MSDKTPVNQYSEFVSNSFMLQNAVSPYSHPRNSIGMRMNFDIMYPFGLPMLNNMD